MTTTLPRRELNRQQTWEALHSTASTLVLQHGLAAATVDAIADGAGVSRRTFFNYFATKEDAVLGTRPASLSDDDIAAFEQSDDGLARVVLLMTAAMKSVFHSLPAHGDRRKLLKAQPELRARLDQHIRDAEALVQAQLTKDAPGDAEAEQDARALLMLAGTVVRFAYTPRPDGTIDDRPEAIEAAITRFRSVIKEAL